ncbi:unnamed protein product, partial [Ectocarpus sp. 8 AP-2014]
MERSRGTCLTRRSGSGEVGAGAVHGESKGMTGNCRFLRRPSDVRDVLCMVDVSRVESGRARQYFTVDFPIFCTEWKMWVGSGVPRLAFGSDCLVDIYTGRLVQGRR